MSDAVDRGVTVTELASRAEPIGAAQETTAAFVGRALRGPLNEPVLVTRFADFRRRFGDIWTRSSLGPAVAQFFEHGGRRAYVVRVANKARGAMVCLPASGTALVLRAIEPGSTERIRAAVDYDAIGDDVHFNLTVQRIDPETLLVSDQEIYRRTSVDPDDERYIVDQLLTSTLVRAESPLPTHRPECTGDSSGFTYALHAQDGSDGTELTDYDLVGSRREEAGLFALAGVPHFDLLYLPALGKGRDAGATSILAADRYCRERGAMLIVDPDRDWTTPLDAVHGLRDSAFSSPNMLCYFPRMRLRDQPDSRQVAVGGAVAGLLAKLDQNAGCWRSGSAAGLRLKRRYVVEHAIATDSLAPLARAGINAITTGTAGAPVFAGTVTLGCGADSPRAFASLPVRRLTLRLLADIDAGTRWAVFDPNRATLPGRLEILVMAYLDTLRTVGALDAVVDVRADLAQPRGAAAVANRITLHVIFTPAGCERPLALTLHQSVEGCRTAATAFGPSRPG